MGVLTDLFVAFNEELRAAFPSRVTVKPEPIVREARNPFTGKVVRTKEWVPAEPFPTMSASVGSQMKYEREAFLSLPHLECKGLDPIMLAALWTVLQGGDLHDHMDSITRPALLAPGDPDDWLYQLPDGLVSALEPLPASTVVEVASQWSKVEEFKASNWRADDGREVLLVLTELARKAINSQRSMYLWVSL
jgi:hypothetical protein